MEFNSFFKSIIEQDNCSVVICNLQHEIIYMNPAAVKNYAKRGGAALVGQCLFDCHNPHSREMIEKVIAWFLESPEHNRIHSGFNKKQNKDIYMIALRDDSKKLIGYYEKHEFRTQDETPFYEFN